VSHEEDEHAIGDKCSKIVAASIFRGSLCRQTERDHRFQLRIKTEVNRAKPAIVVPLATIPKQHNSARPFCGQWRIATSRPVKHDTKATALVRLGTEDVDEVIAQRQVMGQPLFF
jgi:hypothetical protein